MTAFSLWMLCPSANILNNEPHSFFARCSTYPTNTSAKNLAFLFDSTLSFSKQILSVSSFYHYRIRDIRRIRHTIDFTTVSNIATSLVHS